MKNLFKPKQPEFSYMERKRRPLSVQMRHRLREGLFLLTVAAAVFLFVSLLTYQSTDPGWTNTGDGKSIANWGGRLGAWLSDVGFTLVGFIAYFIPFLIVFVSWLSLEPSDGMVTTRREWLIKTLGWVLVITSGCGLSHYYLSTILNFPAQAGGILGYLVGTAFSPLLSKMGSSLLFAAAFLSGITLVTGLSWLGLLDMLGMALFNALSFIVTLLQRPKPNLQLPPLVMEPFNEPELSMRTEPLIHSEPANCEPVWNEEGFIETPEESPHVQLHNPTLLSNSAIPTFELPQEKRMEVSANMRFHPGPIPSVTLLNPPSPNTENAFTSISFEELSLLVEQRLSDFGVAVKVVAVHPGPVITRFELDLAPGIKVSKITGLVKDIARSLSTVSVRIVEVIPGKSVIGLEIPNEHRELVTLRDILESQRYIQSRSPVSLVLGKDISGNPVVVDLNKMPHLLVAGTTGSGKSVSLNAMLLSMLFKSTPDQLRLIMIDPKMLELSVYDGIPHLLTPVITDMKDAANALRWCVAEMDKRYRLMAALGVRNIASYNQKVTDAIKQGEPLMMPGALVTDEESAKMELEAFPLVVVVIDELADMMMVVGKKVEDLIARIAQKARAAGIHLIIATQRPSVDVITGLIKANIPTRIAFQVSSRIDSRTILDQQGAEQLLGHGDMLYLPPGAGVPIRVHGAYVADDEVHRVVAAWRNYGQPNYVYEVTDEITEAGQDPSGLGEQDPLYDEAVKIVTESRRASISLVQRRLRIGYNRAARMMEIMEAAGIVSSMDNSGTREVLVGAPVE